MKNIKVINEVKNILDKFGPEILTGCAIIFSGLAIKAAMDKARLIWNCSSMGVWLTLNSSLTKGRRFARNTPLNTGGWIF